MNTIKHLSKESKEWGPSIILPLLAKYNEIRKEGIEAALNGKSDSPPHTDYYIAKIWIEGYDSVVITEES